MRLKDRLSTRYGTTSDLAAVQILVERCFPGIHESYDRVDVLAVAKEAGIPVERTSSTSFEGRIQWDTKGAARLTVSSMGSSVRQRFTIAHELGHFALRKEMLDECGSEAFRAVSTMRSQVAEEEEFANLIAAEILMPRPAVQRQIKVSGLSLAGLRSLASHFDVSRMAMLQRISDVASVPALYLSVVPSMFKRLSTAAEIDDAVHVIPGKPLKKYREQTLLLDSPKFSELMQRASTMPLSIVGGFGQFVGKFDSEFANRPFPNLTLLSFNPISAIASQIA